MKKNKETAAERKATCNRKFKRFLRERRIEKLKFIRRDSIKKEKADKELAFRKHMARLTGELGAV